MVPFNRDKLKEWAGADVFRRAELLVEGGRTRSVEFKNDRITGWILARPRDIRSEMIFKDGLPENLCPCRDNRELGLICHHVIALCLAYLETLEDPARLEALRMEQERARRMSQAEYITRVAKGSKGAISVDLRLQLAVDAPDYWIDDATRVYALLEHKEQRRPLSDVKPGLTLGLSPEHDNVLFVLEDIAEGPVPVPLEVAARDLGNIFGILKGDHVLIGDRLVTVQTTVLDPVIEVRLDEEGGQIVLALRLEGPDGLRPVESALVAGKEGWLLIDDGLYPMATVLPEPLWDIYRGEKRLARADVPGFVRGGLRDLQAIAQVVTDVEENWFHFQPVLPNMTLKVKGSPASLSARCLARYGEVEIVTAAHEAENRFVIPDPDNILRYHTRNKDAEEAALRLLGSVGFPGQRGDALGSIVGRNTVMSFCASAMPMLRRHGWQVEVEGRIADAIENMQSLIPVVDVDSGTGEDWMSVSCHFETDSGQQLDLKAVRTAIQKGQSYVEKNDELLLFDRDAIQQMFSVFDECEARGDLQGGAKLNPLYGAYLKSSLDALDGIDVDATPDWLAEAEKQNRSGNAQLEDIEPGPAVQATLRPYQREGLSWLRYMEKSGFAGILADEMGLGKTLQTLCWIQLQRTRENAQGEPVLIVCPTSLVENWKEKGEKFTPHLRFLNLTGSQREKAWGNAHQADVWITSYAVLRRDIDRYLDRSFSVVVLDEAQHIKNRSTQNAQAVKRIHAHHRLVLTGTPVENSVADLWSIMDFLMHGYLGPHDVFRRQVEVPIRDGGPEAEDAQKRLQKKLHPFLLRRLKKDVAKDLPPKIEKVTNCDMTPDQRLVYDQVLEQSQEKIESLVAAQGFERSRMEILTLLLRLRQACCHIDLLKLDGVHSKNPSGKLQMFREMMNEAVDGGHRVLVFSQFTSMLHILRSELDQMELKCCYLDGSTKNRMDQVRQFQSREDIPAFLISLKAGGTGLNLTGADLVIHFDPWWNPAVEAQATDRAYRIGQQRTVYSMKLITRNSVEEKVLAMQRKKQAIIDATLSADASMMKALSWDDVQDLFKS